VTPPADLALVHRLLEETGASRSHPPPGWSGYAEAVGKAFADWLQSRVPGLQGLSSLPAKLGPFVSVMAALLVAAILYAAARAAYRRRAQRHAAAPAAPPAPSASPAVVEHDRQDWRREIDRRLAAGDVDGTLEAVWWWFARSVSGGRVDPSWTSHELLARCSRTDLTPLARGLDRLLYGQQRPRPDDVRRFLGRLEAALP
jgi:hypothetical protein